MPACTELWSVRCLGDLFTRPRMFCRCESVCAAFLAAAENPLELRRLLPAPSGLCATGSEVLTTVCLLYLFYNSKRLYLLFTNPYPWSFMSSLVATSMTGSVDVLCEGPLWRPV